MKQLSAPYGKYTILGNHDYGDYARWKNQAEKDANDLELASIEKQMGFTWLNNMNIPININNDTIYLAGVENWGLPPFPQHGNLKKALEGPTKDDFMVLLSHDPTHWDAQVVSQRNDIQLMLAGHTHGFQFGVEIPGFRWSPSQYLYEQWAGLYKKGNQHLYVNRGFGFLGYPGRVGILPEVTILRLVAA